MHLSLVDREQARADFRGYFYGANALSSCTCRKWFQRFRTGNFCLEDEERSGRPPQTDEDKIRDLVEKSRSLTVQEMSNVLKISKTTINRCLNDQV